MLIPAKVFLKIGKFRDDFFMYCEDQEFCFRASMADIKLLFASKIVARHKVAASSRKNNVPKAYYGYRNQTRIVWENGTFLNKIFYLGFLFSQIPGLLRNPKIIPEFINGISTESKVIWGNTNEFNFRDEGTYIMQYSFDINRKDFSSYREYLGEKEYRQLKKVIVELIKGSTLRLSSESNLLDMACWDGLPTSFYGRSLGISKLFGLDFFDNQIEKAKDNGVNVFKCNFETDKFPFLD